MEAYAIFLTIILTNDAEIKTRVAYFDTYDECAIALRSDEYTRFIHRRWAGIGAKSMISICDKVDSI